MRSDALVMIGIALVCGMAASVVVSHWVDGPEAGAPPPARTERIYIAHLDIAAGQPLRPDALRLETWDADRVPHDAITRLEEVAGKISRATIRRGFPIQEVLLTTSVSPGGLRPGPESPDNPAANPASPPLPVPPGSNDATVAESSPADASPAETSPAKVSVASRTPRTRSTAAVAADEPTHLVNAVPAEPPGETPAALAASPTTSPAEPMETTLPGSPASPANSDTPVKPQPTALSDTASKPGAAVEPEVVATPVHPAPQPAPLATRSSTPRLTASSEAVPAEAGPAEAGPAEAGPAEAGPAEAGPAEPVRPLTPSTEAVVTDRAAGTREEAGELPVSAPSPAERYPRPAHARAAATISDDGWVRIRRALDAGANGDAACNSRGAEGQPKASTPPTPPVASRPAKARPSGSNTGNR